MSAVPYVNGIGELTGREPIGVCMSIGRKGPKGNPVDNDRFYMVVPQEVDGVRELHPSFSGYNSAPVEKRTVMRGNIVHSAVADCFQYSLKAQVLPGQPPHPNKAPCCTGNSVTAQRWNPAANDGRGAYQEIPCPADRCPFRQQEGNRPTPCKPFARLLFRPRWPDNYPAPALLTKWTTGSWNTVASLLGMFEHVEKLARELGLPGFSVLGLPFVLTLGRKKRSDGGGGRSFPIVSASIDGDIIEFFELQQKRLAALGGHAPPLIALTDASQQSAEEHAADHNQVTPRPGSIDVSVPSSK